MVKGRPVLIVGADSMIGNALLEALESSGLDVYSTTRRKDRIGSERNFFLDLAHPNASDFTDLFLDNCTGGTAFILAAETSVVACDRNPDQSHAINVVGTEALAKILIERGMRVLFLSTNLVFDGSVPHRNADDSPCPQTAYGRQKAEAESKLLSLSDETVIVRLTKVFNKDQVLLKVWVESLRKNQAIHPFADMIVAPVPLTHVVSVLARLVDSQVKGILQISGPVDITYADIARELAKRLGTPIELVQPVQSESQMQGILPVHATLDTSLLEKFLGAPVSYDVWSFLDIFCLAGVRSS